MKLRTSIFLCVILAALLTLGALAADKISAGSDAVYFVSNGTGSDSNAGTSASAPLKTLGAAVSKLKTAGGTIVVCAPVKVANWTPAAMGGTTIVTSLYDGVDYAKTAGAYIYMTGASSTVTANSPLYFENITFDLQTKDTRFAANCHDFGFLSGVSMVKNCEDAAFSYPWIIGGYNASSQMTADTFDNDYTLTIESGHFGVLFLGNRRTSDAQPISDLAGDIGLNISGGIFDSTVYCSGMNVHTGRLAANISGGDFNGQLIGFCRLGALPAADKMTASAYTAPLTLNISGGNFNARVRLAESKVETTGVTRPVYSDAAVCITGGSFGADVCGYGVVGETLIKYDPDVLSADVIKGFPNKTTDTSPAAAPRVTATFTNPIRGGGADPYIIEKDGVYYYCISSSVTIDGTAYAAVKVAAHGSIAFGELSTQLRAVFNSSKTTVKNAQHEYWAPELHYFTKEEVGDAAGWYIYVAADDGDNKNHRMYVLRATEPENPLSDYEFAGQITTSDNHWAIDGTVLHLGGKIYFIWSGWEGSTNVAQNIYIAEMSSPTAISSARTLLSAPTYAWERHGNPYVNEGPQILQRGDTTHIIYSASGSWTQYYCYGILTYTGTDPLSADSWTKQADTIFSSSAQNSVYGPGHGTFTTAPDGSPWMIYHANLSTTVPAGSTWWGQRKVFAKPFEWTTKTIGGKSYAWPRLGAPTAAAQTIAVAAADYHTEHFLGATYTRITGSLDVVYRPCLLCDAETVLSATFTAAPTLTVSTGGYGELRLTYPAISGADGYNIYRKAPGQSDYTLLTATDKTAYTDASLAPYSVYSYKVCAYAVRQGKTYLSAESAAAEARTLCTHVYDSGEVTKAPTLTETGVRTYTCTLCGDRRTETIEKVTATPKKTTAGDLFDAVGARARQNEFALWTVETTGDESLAVPVEIEAPEDFTVTYVYAMVGEFILPIDFTEDDGKLSFTAKKDTAYAFCGAPLLVYGDATGDGVLSLTDILRTLRALSGEDVIIDKAAADISHSASLGVDDALLTLQKLLLEY